MAPAEGTPELGQLPRELVLSEQRLQIGTRWVEAKLVTAEVRIVTEVQTFEVEVRRQELVVTESDLPEADPRRGVQPGRRPPTVIVLHEEVPVVTLQTQPYERVTLRVETRDQQQDVTVALAHEELADRS